MTQSTRGDDAWQARTAKQRQRQREIAELVAAEG